LNVYYNIAVLGKKVEKVLKGSGVYTTTQVSDIRFYVLYAVFADATRKTAPSAKDIISLQIELLTDDFVLSVANHVFELYCKHGGTDRAAKGYELIVALKEHFDKIKKGAEISNDFSRSIQHG
jgi:hypothetical protein